LLQTGQVGVGVLFFIFIFFFFSRVFAWLRGRFLVGLLNAATRRD